MACVVTLVLCLFAGLLCAGPVQTGTELVSNLPDALSRSRPTSYFPESFRPHSPNDHQSTSTSRTPAVYGGVDNPYGPCSDWHVPATTPAASMQSRDPEMGNDYAMVCGSDSHKFTTNTCAGSPFRYYCTAKGSLTKKGTYNSHCAEVCRCVNLAPKPCLHGVVAVTCYISADGTILDSNLETIGDTSTAIELSNGTWLLDSGSPLHGLELRSLSGSDVSKTSAMAISGRDSNAAMHDYALVCADRGGTQRCKDRSYYCKSSGKVAYRLSDYFCDTVCECKNLRAQPKPCANIYEADLHKFVCFDDIDPFMNATGQDTSSNLTINNSVLNFTNGSVRRDVNLPALTDPGCHPQNQKRRLLLCQNHTQACSTEFGYCCQTGSLTSASHNPICNDICKCMDMSSGPIRYCTHGPNFSILSECFVDGNVIYKIEGDLMTDFLGNFTNAVVGACANLWIGEPGMSPYPPIDVPPPQITDVVAKRDEEVADMAQDKWVLACQNKAHTQTCRNKLHYSCDGAKVVTHQDWDFVCEAICVCYDQDPDQICVPRHAISGVCPPGVLQDPPTVGSEKDVSIITERQDTMNSDSISVSERSLDDSGRDAPWYFICMAKDSVNTTLTNYCLAEGYTCPHNAPRQPKPLRPEHHDPLCEKHSSCSCRKAYTPSHDDEGAMIQRDLFASNSLFVPAHVSHEVKRDLSTDRQFFSLACETGNHLNVSLTKYCAEKSYHCVPGEILSELQHDGPVDAQCSQSCHCRTPFTKAEDLSSRSVAEAAERKYFSMACNSGNHVNATLTHHCAEESYRCVPGEMLSTLRHDGAGNAQCSQNCYCRTPFVGAEGLSPRSELVDDAGYSLHCGHQGDEFYRTGYHVLSTRCQVLWGYTCDVDGQVHHGGTPVFKCDETCSCHKSNNTTVVGA
ncbi:hypothetical protein H2204_009410 [Knufia peltigerae]|uniref:Uncharacterized protein n=1 Tax=Knufia peltigerae TaxID=1002370 RepID=A0AA38XZ69_9EURO|nr:hypothetical protein H2204_009410 [Knufia peltigerae]